MSNLAWQQRSGEAMSEHFPAPWRVDPHSFAIYAQDVPKGPARVAEMRGWGYLTGKGHGALGLPDTIAIEIQKANADFLVEAVNNHDALVARVKYLEATEANEIWRLKRALQTIADMEPATTDMTLAHAMAQEAKDALAGVGGVHDQTK